MSYIVVWKDAPGQQVSTVVDAHDVPVQRDEAYLARNNIVIYHSQDDVLETLEAATGHKFAITADLARSTLGWDV